MINVGVMTHNEKEAFTLLKELRIGKTHGVGGVWVMDDMSDPDYVEPLFELLVSRGMAFSQRALNADFSAQRNALLDLMPKGEWTLMLDADERVGESFCCRATSCLRDENDCMLVPRRNEHVEDNGDVEVVVEHLPRLFRNDPHIRFAGVVHEQLVGFKKQGVLRPTLEIIHRKTRQRMHAQHQFYTDHFYSKGIR